LLAGLISDTFANKIVQPTEQVIVGLFTEVRRHKPSVIYIPNIDAWYGTLAGSIALITFQTMLDSIPPTDPILLLATAECDKIQDLSDVNRAFFGFTRKNRMEIPRPRRVSAANTGLQGMQC
jgi:SpoVK/Ycf46/Vps4 family AAA+-type ATPase